MAAIPTVERPPKLKPPWLGVWRAALKSMKAHGTWAPEMRPLLDEYVYALRAAADARAGFKWLDDLRNLDAEEIDWQVLGRIASGLPNVWDKHAKRASTLADQLGLTPRSRGALTSKDGDGDGRESDPFAALDELAPRRTGRAGK